MRVLLSIDGNAACALLGEDLQSGECEFKPIEGEGREAARAAASKAYEKLVDRLGERYPYELGEGLI